MSSSLLNSWRTKTAKPKVRAAGGASGAAAASAGSTPGASAASPTSSHDATVDGETPTSPASPAVARTPVSLDAHASAEDEPGPPGSAAAPPGAKHADVQAPDSEVEQQPKAQEQRLSWAQREAARAHREASVATEGEKPGEPKSAAESDEARRTLLAEKEAVRARARESEGLTAQRSATASEEGRLTWAQREAAKALAAANEKQPSGEAVKTVPGREQQPDKKEEVAVLPSEEAPISSAPIGAILVARWDAPVFASVDSGEAIGTVCAGKAVVVAGETEIVDGYAMVPIQPKGAVELRLFDVAAKGVDADLAFAEEQAVVEEPAQETSSGLQVGDVLIAKWEAPVFASTQSGESLRTLQAGDSVQVGGAVEDVDGYSMVPIQPEGAVELCLFTVKKAAISFCPPQRKVCAGSSNAAEQATEKAASEKLADKKAAEEQAAEIAAAEEAAAEKLAAEKAADERASEEQAAAERAAAKKAAEEKAAAERAAQEKAAAEKAAAAKAAEEKAAAERAAAEKAALEKAAAEKAAADKAAAEKAAAEKAAAERAEEERRAAEKAAMDRAAAEEKAAAEKAAAKKAEEQRAAAIGEAQKAAAEKAKEKAADKAADDEESPTSQEAQEALAARARARARARAGGILGQLPPQRHTGKVDEPTEQKEEPAEKPEANAPEPSVEEAAVALDAEEPTLEEALAALDAAEAPAAATPEVAAADDGVEKNEEASPVHAEVSLVALWEAPIFESPESGHSIGTVPAGAVVVAAGAPQMVDGYPMVPIQPTGAVELNLFSSSVPADAAPCGASSVTIDASASDVEEELLNAVKTGVVLTAKWEAPIFESAESGYSIGIVDAGQTVTAAGSPQIIEGYAMAPICPTGAVELKLFALHEAPKEKLREATAAPEVAKRDTAEESEGATPATAARAHDPAKEQQHLEPLAIPVQSGRQSEDVAATDEPDLPDEVEATPSASRELVDPAEGDSPASSCVSTPPQLAEPDVPTEDDWPTEPCPRRSPQTTGAAAACDEVAAPAVAATASELPADSCPQPTGTAPAPAEEVTAAPTVAATAPASAPALPTLAAGNVSPVVAAGIAIGDHFMAIKRVLMRTGEGTDSEFLGYLPAGRLLEILEVGQGRRVRVVEETGVSGWVSVAKESGEQLLARKQTLTFQERRLLQDAKRRSQTTASNEAADRSSRTLASTSAPPAAQSGKCDKCDGPHPTDACPFFKKDREDHKDAHVNLGGLNKSLSMGSDGGDFVLRNSRVVRQPGDGSCLFHSMMFGLQQVGGLSSRGSAEELRREIAEFIRENPKFEISGDTIEEWIQWDANSTVDQYTRQMGQRGWGGGVEMACFSILKSVNVHVYEQKGGGEFKRISCFNCPDSKKTVHVLYQGRCHYDALVPSS
eukprot:gnl/TRDRNA2_/TRDRNA2_173839_c3_seq17.p1 gnl/TRDRNA2_/TRDRNA2_173839_c3~~gnl/TRDRNA2_/TRDRNA2_173839_c3_seq17.p1  ORF type:complete len:1391 (+),score=408.67 gnl/TRDRNA2_/TRDRNA2_173839_c3_seq17:98-4270(+)